MKKRIIFYIVLNLIFLAIIVSLFLWGASVVRNGFKDGDFLYITLEGLFNLAVTIAIGGLLTVLIVVYTAARETKTKIHDEIKESLKTIQNCFEERLEGVKLGTNDAWTKALSSKKITEIILNELCGFEKDKEILESVNLIKNLTDSYFTFIEEKCYLKAKISKELITEESNIRYEVIAQIQKAILLTVDR